MAFKVKAGKPEKAREVPVLGSTTTLRRQLLTLALVTTLPFLVFSSAIILWISHIHGVAARQGLETTTSALSLALTMRLETYKAALAALATSPALDQRDVAALYGQAEATARRYGVWIAVALPSGQQIVNTLRPFGAELPQSHPATLPPSLSSDGVVHNLFEGPVADRLIVGITVPALRNRVVTHYLHLGLFPGYLVTFLEKERLPAEWFVVLVDGQNRVIARAPNVAGFVGEPAAAWYVQGSAGAQSGFLTGQALDGTEVFVTFERLSNAPWTVAVGMPLATLDRAWQHPLALLAGGGAVLALAISAIFVLLGPRLTNPMDSLAAAARAVMRGEPLPPVPTSSVRELGLLRNAVVELSQKQILLREVNHRIKNSLQLVSSTLGLQSRTAPGADARTQFRDARARIMAIARLHERLYKADEYEQVDACALARAVCEDIATIGTGAVILRFDAEGVAQLSSAAAGAFALIVAELATNAMKHASEPGRAGEVDIRCRVEDGPVISVVVSDNGPGLPPGFDLAAQKGLGLRMCLTLASQVGGTLRAVPSSGGAAFELRIPALEP